MCALINQILTYHVTAWRIFVDVSTIYAIYFNNPHEIFIHDMNSKNYEESGYGHLLNLLTLVY